MGITPAVGGKVEVRLGRIVEDALSWLYRAEERPLTVFVGANELSSEVDVTMTMKAENLDEIHRTDLLEGGHEIMLVVDRTDDASPVLTVDRAYAGTPNGGAHLTNTVLLKNPRWKRHDVWRALLQGLEGTIGGAVPMTERAVIQVTDGWYAELPDYALGVLQVGVGAGGPTDRVRWVDDWEYMRDHPQAASGQGIDLSTAILGSYDQVVVKYIVPYPTKGPTDTDWNESPLPQSQAGEDYLVELWVGTEDVAALYAAAMRLTGREMSRIDVTEMEQWNSDNAQRYNVNLTAAKFMWQTFYQRLDELRRQHAGTFGKHRPFKRRLNVGSFGRYSL